MKTVFLFVAKYVYTSDFLWTGYIKHLSSKYKVVVFIPDILSKIDNPYPKLPNVTYVAWDEQYPRFWNLFSKYLRYSMTRKFLYEPVLRRSYRKGMKNWRRRFFRLLSYLFPKQFLTPALFSKIEVLLLPIPLAFKKLCDEHKPAIILTATPGFNSYDAEAITMGKKLGITTSCVSFSWDNFHNGSNNIRKPDFMILWNEILKKEALKLHNYPPEKVLVSGIIRFDHYFKPENVKISREVFLKSKGLDPREKVITITTVTDGNYPAEHKLIQRLLDAREEGKLRGYPNIFIRLHPKDSMSKYAHFKGVKNVHVEDAGKRLSIDLGSEVELDAEDLMNVKYTLMYSDVIINYASTMTLEAFIFDKPVINIGFPAKHLDTYGFFHYKPITESGAVNLAYSFEEMINGILEYFEHPEKDRALRKKIFDEFIHFNDGRSIERNVLCIDKILTMV